MFGLEHARDILQVVQVGLLGAGLREGHGDDALRHVGQVEFVAFLHLGGEKKHSRYNDIYGCLRPASP